MHFIRKTNFTRYFCGITLVAMLFGGCANQRAELRPDPNMVLHAGNFEPIVDEAYILNPWAQNTFGSNRIFRNLFISNAGTGEISMDMAESYKVSPDGLVYEITLKDDLLWSDGEVVTLLDVVCSIENTFFISLPNTLFITTFSGIEGAKAYAENPDDVGSISGLQIDENKLTIHLETPNHLLIDTLSQFAILPKHKLDNMDLLEMSDFEFWHTIVGSGMYKVGAYVPEEYLELVYNECYTEQAPYISAIRLYSDYEVGSLGYYETSNIAEILEYRSVTNVTEHIANNLFYRYFVFNIIKGDAIDPVLNDVRVRQAITYAINRPTLIQNIYYDTGTIINTGVVESYNQPLEVNYPYNPEKAMDLLAEANYDFDRPIELMYYYSDDISIAFMEEVAKYLEAVGLTVNLTGSGHLYTDEYDFYDIGLKGLSAFSHVDWYNEYLSTSQLYSNIFGVEDAFDDLISELSATTTEADKIDILQELQKLEYETIYKYPIFRMGHNVYINNQIDIPDDVVFGDSKFKFDIQIEDWKIDYDVDSIGDLWLKLLLAIAIVFIVIKSLFVKKELHHNQKLLKKMYIDTATGIYNDTKCQEVMKTPALPEDHATDRALVIFDLNDLKKTNDTLGHRVGDQLIYDFAQEIKKASESFSDEIFVGRYGGDEFIAFLDDITEQDVTNYINAVHQSIQLFNETEDKEYKLSCAIGYGITTADTKTATMKQLFDIADQDMYQNKMAMKARKK